MNLQSAKSRLRRNFVSQIAWVPQQINCKKRRGMEGKLYREFNDISR